MGERMNELLNQLKQSPERLDEVATSYRRKLHKAREDIRGYHKGIEQYNANIERLEASAREYELMVELFDTLKEEK